MPPRLRFFPLWLAVVAGCVSPSPVKGWTAAPYHTRHLLQADITEVATAAELRAALQEGRPHVRVTDDLDLRGDPSATSAAGGRRPWKGLTVNGTQSLVGACVGGGDAAVPRREGQCVLRADRAALDAHSANLWIHNLLLLLDVPAAAGGGAGGQAVVRHSRGNLWASALTVRGAGRGWTGPIVGIASGHNIATYLGNVLITDIGEATAAIETNSSATLDAVTVAGLWTPPNRGVVTVLATSGHNLILLTNWTTSDTSEPQFALLETKAAAFFSDEVLGQRSNDLQAYRMQDPANSEPFWALTHAQGTAEEFGVSLINMDSSWLRRTRAAVAPPPPTARAAKPQPPGAPGASSLSSSSDSAAAGLLTWLLPVLFGLLVFPLVVCVCIKRRHRIKAAVRQPVGEPQVLAARAESTDSSSSSSSLGLPGGMPGSLAAFRPGAVLGGKPAPDGAVQLAVRPGSGVDAGWRDGGGPEADVCGWQHHTHFFTMASTQSSHGSLGAPDSNRDLSGAELYPGWQHELVTKKGTFRVPALACAEAATAVDSPGRVALIKQGRAAAPPMSPALAAAESACAAWAQSDGPLALRVGSYDAVIIRAAGEAAIASQPECAVRVVMIEEVEECATAFLRAPADSPQRLPVRLVPPAGGPQWPGTLRVFSTRAAFEKHCDMYARDITGARVLAPLFAVHAPDAADSAAKTTTPIDRLRAFGMTLSLKTTPTDSAGAAQDGPSTWDRAPMDLVRDVRLGTAMNRLVYLRAVLAVLRRLHDRGGLVHLSLTPLVIRHSTEHCLATCATAVPIGAAFSVAALDAERRAARVPLLYTAPEVVQAAVRGAAQMRAAAAADRWSLGVLALHGLHRCGMLPAALRDTMTPLLQDWEDEEAPRVCAMAGGQEPYPWEVIIQDGGTGHPQEWACPDLRVALALLRRTPGDRATISHCIHMIDEAVLRPHSPGADGGRTAASPQGT